MIAFVTVMAAAAAIASFAGARLARGKRILVSLLVFLIPVIGLTAWVVAVGDRIPADAVNVDLADETLPECERLMRTLESNTADEQARQRLDDRCPGWESMR